MKKTSCLERTQIITVYPKKAWRSQDIWVVVERLPKVGTVFVSSLGPKYVVQAEPFTSSQHVGHLDLEVLWTRRSHSTAAWEYQETPDAKNRMDGVSM